MGTHLCDNVLNSVPVWLTAVRDVFHRHFAVRFSRSKWVRVTVNEWKTVRFFTIQLFRVTRHWGKTSQWREQTNRAMNCCSSRCCDCRLIGFVLQKVLLITNILNWRQNDWSKLETEKLHFEFNWFHWLATEHANAIEIGCDSWLLLLSLSFRWNSYFIEIQNEEN